MNKIFDEIKIANKILLLAHENPDGDAIGSLMAMYHMLKDLGKDVLVVVPEIPPAFLYLNGIDKVLSKTDDTFDLGIVVDCANKERIGQINNEFSNCKKTIVIDHHISNSRYGDINYVEEVTASCTQVLYYLFKKWNINITNDIGEAIITGCLTDTSGFRNNNVDKNTFMMAAELMDIGIDINKIYYLAVSKKSMAQYLLMKMTLDRLEMFEDGKIAFSYISEEDFANVGALPGDHEGLVDLGRNIGGVEVSIFMREDDGYRISFRSNGNIDVNEIAKKFGGGGHKMAAGAKIDGDFKETKNKVLLEIKKEFKH